MDIFFGFQAISTVYRTRHAVNHLVVLTTRKTSYLCVESFVS